MGLRQAFECNELTIDGFSKHRSGNGLSRKTQFPVNFIAYHQNAQRGRQLENSGRCFISRYRAGWVVGIDQYDRFCVGLDR